MAQGKTLTFNDENGRKKGLVLKNLPYTPAPGEQVQPEKLPYTPAQGEQVQPEKLTNTPTTTPTTGGQTQQNQTQTAAPRPYNAYNAWDKITNTYKSAYHTAKDIGQDPTQYYEGAIPWYQELYDNGYGALADDLANSDYITALGLAEKYGLKPDAQFNLDTDYAALTAQQATDDKLLERAIGYDDTYQKLVGTAQNIASGQTQPGLSPGAQALYDSWMAGNDRLNGEVRYDENGNVISGLNTEHYNLGRDQLDRINNFDVTQQPYYQGIMDQYRLGGRNAALGEYAAGAAANGGNIDSYAAANANRQQLAFTTAGQQAALAAAQQNAQNWQTLYAQMSADLQNQGALSQDTLDQARALYASDAAERENALNTAADLAKQGVGNAMDAYLGRLGSADTRYGYDTQKEMNAENNATTREGFASQERIAEGQNETTKAGYASQERMNTENNAAQIKIAETEAGASIQIANISAETQKYVSAMEAEVNKAIAKIQSNTALGTAQIGANAQLGTAQINADASKSVAATQAGAQLGTAQIQASTEEKIAKMGYSSSEAQLAMKIAGDFSMAELTNAATLQQILAGIQGQKELAAYDRDTQVKIASNAVTNALKLQEGQYEMAAKYAGTTPDYDDFNNWCLEAYAAWLDQEGEFAGMDWDHFKTYLGKSDEEAFDGSHQEYLSDFFKTYKPENDLLKMGGGYTISAEEN